VALRAKYPRYVDAVTAPIGVYSMYWLFSHTKTTGAFQTAAMLSVS
jgi:hypothetical protein